jgi:PAS domain S-box-containing protein
MPVDPVKFLLVDDVRENLVALEALLRRDGLEILTASSGNEALELLLVHEFALALLDVQLPEMDGFELAEYMRSTERTRRVPIIFLTAVATDERRRFMGYESGAVDYLIKPIDPHVLRRKAEVFFELDQQRRELVRQRDEIRESGERFRRAVMQAPAPMMLFDDQQQVLTINAEWQRITGYAPADLQTLHEWAERALGDRANDMAKYLSQVFQSAEPCRAEFDLVTQLGHILTWDLVASPVNRASDGSGLYLWVGHDITVRKHAERTQQLLIGELNHRVKNTLATVQAIAQQTLRRSADPREFAASFSGRIQALSRAHSMLSNTTWKGADILELVRDQMALGAFDESRISVSGPPVSLEPQRALHVALMLHELATNANKYGSLLAPAGRVAISWKMRDGQLLFKWIESGGPKVQAPEHHGFGTTLIEQTAKGDGGYAKASYGTGGVEWNIMLPLRADPLGTKKGETDAPRPPEAQTSSALAGKSILVVEDEPLVALDLVTKLEQAGALVAGPAGTALEAIKIIDTMHLDGVLLDGNLHGQRADAVAEVLMQKRVPFAFVTGYGRASLPRGFADVPILGKPFTESQLLRTALALVSANPNSAVPSRASVTPT